MRPMEESLLGCWRSLERHQLSGWVDRWMDDQHDQCMSPCRDAEDLWRDTSWSGWMDGLWVEWTDDQHDQWKSPCQGSSPELRRQRDRWSPRGAGQAHWEQLSLGWGLVWGAVLGGVRRGRMKPQRWGLVGGGGALPGPWWGQEMGPIGTGWATSSGEGSNQKRPADGLGEGSNQNQPRDKSRIFQNWVQESCRIRPGQGGPIQNQVGPGDGSYQNQSVSGSKRKVQSEPAGWWLWKMGPVRTGQDLGPEDGSFQNQVGPGDRSNQNR